MLLFIWPPQATLLGEMGMIFRRRETLQPLACQYTSSRQLDVKNTYRTRCETTRQNANGSCVIEKLVPASTVPQCSLRLVEAVTY